MIYPLVSALMVTQRGREKFATQALRAFDQQTWPNRELVVVHDTGEMLSELRNHTLERALGEYLIQWDDDDEHHPARITQQMKALDGRPDVDVCCLSLVTVECALCGWAGISRRDAWDNTMLVRAGAVENLHYQAAERGEDSAFMNQLRQAGKRFTVLDAPHLYTYRFHGGNTWGAEHFAEFFMQSGHDPRICVINA